MRLRVPCNTFPRAGSVRDEPSTGGHGDGTDGSGPPRGETCVSISCCAEVSRYRTLSPEPESKRLALGCIAHEAAHVEHESHLYRMFPDSYGKPLGVRQPFATGLLEGDGCLERICCVPVLGDVSPGSGGGVEGILCRAIEDSSAAALEQIKAHREGARRRRCVSANFSKSSVMFLSAPVTCSATSTE